MLTGWRQRCRSCSRLWLRWGVRADKACPFCGSRNVKAVPE